jgi:uncharacterized UBP type Zn finger protein
MRVGNGRGCEHVPPGDYREPVRTDNCVGCAAGGGRPIGLRVCQTCGYVGCCDSSAPRHARGHYKETGHPVIRPLRGGWTWCYVHDAYVE